MSTLSGSRFGSRYELKGRIWAFATATVAVVAVALLLVAHARRGSISAASLGSSKPNLLASAQHGRPDANFGALPLAFEQNLGQTDAQVQYMARGDGYTLFLTHTDAVFSFRAKAPEGPSARRVALSKSFTARPPRTATPVGMNQARVNPVRMHIVGGNTAAQIAPAELLPGKSNYYLGNDPEKWQIGVRQYARVAYKNVYPGIDLAYYGERRKLEFDFIVAPESNPGSIDLAFSGARTLATDASGDLVISSAAGDVVLNKPVAYQQRDGRREFVDAKFALRSKNNVSFELGNYDRSRELVIDPTVTFATYLGGSGEDEAYAIAVDASGNSYIAGATNSTNFPGTSGPGTSFDVFVSKLSADGSTLLYSTLLGGNGDDIGLGIAVNTLGAFVVGNTESTNFPVTTPVLGSVGIQNTFVAKLDLTVGTALQVTRIGGSGTDSGNAIAVDSNGNTYIGGQTGSTDFPTVLPIQATLGGTFDGFVAELNAAGTALTYSTYLGGSSGDLVTGIGLDGSNNAYVTGITLSSNFPTTPGAFQTAQKGSDDNAFVSAIKADGSALIYSTYLGGSAVNDALALAVDSAGEAYITGDTSSTDFPTANPVQSTLAGTTNVFVSKLTADGTALEFSTYFGGSQTTAANVQAATAQADEGTGIALDAFNDVYVTGRTNSTNYPTSGSAFQTALNGNSDAFITELSSSGFTVYSSYLGGTGDENFIGINPSTSIGAVAVDSSSNAYLAGSTNSTTFSTAGAFQSTNGGGVADGFVAKISAAPADFSVGLSPATISVTSGQTTAAVTVTVSSVNAAFGNAVALSCSAGKPTDAACNFSALTVTPGSAAVTSNLTISTNGSAGNGMLTPPMGGSRLFYAMLLPFAGLALVGIGSRRQKMLGTAALAMILMTLMILPACGGSSSSSTMGGGTSTNTPAGTYTITVSGTANGTTHSVPLTLTVN